MCFRCTKPIESASVLSLDHIKDWLHEENAINLFFDTSNIAFSHKKCNVPTRRNRSTLSRKVGEEGEASWRRSFERNLHSSRNLYGPLLFTPHLL